MNPHEIRDWSNKLAAASIGLYVLAAGMEWVRTVAQQEADAAAEWHEMMNHNEEDDE